MTSHEKWKLGKPPKEKNMSNKAFFFSSPLPTTKYVKLLPECGKCGLYKRCKSPKMPLSGRGKKEILLVGEAPGRNEDIQNRPFVGKAGKFLHKVLFRLGIDMREDCWIMNSLSCRPPNNATPTPKQIGYCRPLVVNQIKSLNPKLIILLGGSAMRSVLGWLWKENVGEATRWVGWRIPHQKLNAWICPTYHPSAVIRTESKKTGKYDPVLEGLFTEYLEKALTKTTRPWKDLPDYKSRVQIVVHPFQAVQYLQAIQKMKNPVAIDFETDGLKPDGGKLDIVSCAVSNGVVSISYPWAAQAIEETKKLIYSPFPKIAANLKFEERWIQTKFGSGATNWKLDTVVAAHTLDNREGVSGLKFQSFVLLGQEPYEVEVKSFMVPAEPGGYAKNRMMELMKGGGMDKLLLYGGLDALLEFEIAKIQAKQLGKDLYEGIEGMHSGPTSENFW